MARRDAAAPDAADATEPPVPQEATGDIHMRRESSSSFLRCFLFAVMPSRHVYDDDIDMLRHTFISRDMPFIPSSSSSSHSSFRRERVSIRC